MSFIFQRNFYQPRACDCDFCQGRGISYLSDPLGRLCFYEEKAGSLGSYVQESTSGLARFLLCKHCDLVLGVVYEEGEELWDAVNVKALFEEMQLGETVVVSPKTLSDQEKITRWKQVWIPCQIVKG